MWYRGESVSPRNIRHRRRVFSRALPVYRRFLPQGDLAIHDHGLSLQYHDLNLTHLIVDIIDRTMIPSEQLSWIPVVCMRSIHG